ncbi:MAG: response regulator [Nitrospina sp.]|jgi:putative two-component system response regulator|nr:response regulator [Nitrospina sp.]MBT3508065.1 response regulator [Nitrospina sp.]MBT3876682.1 response regulator [Nitrospina sp.]MBT4049611.1 response regulator [Nitrospina sp.]MBT4558323.1 response regulator [Nitrospina sp.]
MKVNFLKSKILIVDDEQANIALLEDVLENEGYTFFKSTQDSRKALDIYKEMCPDLVLLDLNMPYLDGFQVIEQLKEFEKDSYAPILVLTAQSDRNTRLRALSAGARDYIEKPFDITEVTQRISNMLEIRLLHNQVRDQNLILEEKIRERTHELEETRREAILRLGRAAEYRDNETGMHVIRMSRLSAKLAKEIGLSDDECQLMLQASPMHDVGKIGVPDQILLKPGKLNEEEWAIMKKHPEIGAEILSGSHSSVMQLAETISLTHQERWDGSGYPNNLKGEEIPLSGRIVAICDVFDALTSKRYYKEAFSVEKAMEIIEQGSGKDFEPYLVDTFKKVLPEMIRIVKELPDNEPADTLKVYRKSSSDDAAQKIHL